MQQLWFQVSGAVRRQFDCGPLRPRNQLAFFAAVSGLAVSFAISLFAGHRFARDADARPAVPVPSVVIERRLPTPASSSLAPVLSPDLAPQFVASLRDSGVELVNFASRRRDQPNLAQAGLEVLEYDVALKGPYPAVKRQLSLVSAQGSLAVDSLRFRHEQGGVVQAQAVITQWHATHAVRTPSKEEGIR